MRKVATLLIALIFAVALAPHAYGQKDKPRQLLPVIVKGKWGFIDRTGKLIVQPTFDAFENLSDGMMAVLIAGKWGFADEAGVMKIAPQFAMTRAFSEGLAAIKVANAWGFINQTGQVVLAPQFEDAGSSYSEKGAFSEGVAPVKIKGKWGFIDKAGVAIVKPQFDQADSFLHGIARVRVKVSDQPGKVGYINKSGKFISQLVNEDAMMHGGASPGQFSEGLTLVVNDGKWGYVNSEGEVVAAGFEAAKGFSENLAAIKVADKWGYVDTSGKIVIQPRFTAADKFSEGLALVTEADGTLGYIDQSGKVVITVGKNKGSFASRFKDGLATIDRVGESGYIDRTGKFVIRLQQGDRGAPFSGELAQVYRGEATTFVNRAGKYLFEPKILFDLGEWSEGMISARAERYGLYGYVDESGKFVIAPQFHQAKIFSDGLAVVRLTNQHGYVDRSGKFVFALQFDDASNFANGIAQVKIGEDRFGIDGRQGERQKIGYIDTTGKYIWKPTN
ncbi:MAG: hypothetical protein QOJ64_1112 [Acidobacteriota bacterium]|nr:hypothetical protein [Acidobacteriota bacterium]